MDGTWVARWLALTARAALFALWAMAWLKLEVARFALAFWKRGPR